MPVPSALLHCADDTVLGAPFYVMERVDGVVYRSRDADRPAHRRPAPRELAVAMMDTLAALHTVDPAAVGLADFGRPEGFLERQVRRWGGQLDRSRSRAAARHRRAARAAGRDRAGGRQRRPDRARRLPAGQPAWRRPTRSPIHAVLDWEMATLGDPLTDLGLLLIYWDVLGDSDAADGNPVADGLGPGPASRPAPS